MHLFSLHCARVDVVVEVVSEEVVELVDSVASVVVLVVEDEETLTQMSTHGWHP